MTSDPGRDNPGGDVGRSARSVHTDAHDAERRRREHRRRRLRRRGRRAYIRSVYFLPSLATLGNAVCGFGAIYIASLVLMDGQKVDPLTRYFYDHQFNAAAALIFLAMVFDGLDGRLARFTRHTTDFGGQLDSLADAVSFGAAPAILALQVIKNEGPSEVPFFVSRLIWAVGALYFSCALLRLARFNVSNEHGEQHHFSFLGLPSPGAGGAVAAWVLVQQDLAGPASGPMHYLALVCTILLGPIVLGTGLLMISNFRYPHLVNRYLRGRRSLRRLLFVVACLLALIVAPKYTLAAGMLIYAFWGPVAWLLVRSQPTKPAAEAQPSLP